MEAVTLDFHELSKTPKSGGENLIWLVHSRIPTPVEDPTTAQLLPLALRVSEAFVTSSRR